MDQNKIGNIIEQMQHTMDGMIERLVKLEGAVLSLNTSNKPSIYIDENTALLSSNDADIHWINRKLNNEMPEMQQSNKNFGDS